MDGEAVGSPERVNWGSEITPGTLIALEGVVVADMVDVDAPSRFQVTAYQPNGAAMQGRHLFISLGLVDDDGSIPTTVSSVASNDGFDAGARVYASSKLSALDGPVETGTVVLVGGDYVGSGVASQDPVIRYKVGTSAAVDATITGDLEEGEVLRAVARHGRDGFMAVGDDGLIVRTRPDEYGHHDLDEWYVERPPCMAADVPGDTGDPDPDLKDVIKLGTGNLIVGDDGTVWLYRPAPVGFPANLTWGTDVEWTRLNVFGAEPPDPLVNLTAAAADHVQDLAMPTADVGTSDWTTPYLDRTAYALVVGEDGFLARFGVNLVERDLDRVGCEGVSAELGACSPTSCSAYDPFDVVTFNGTLPWQSNDLHGVLSDDRTRIVAGDHGTLWTFPKSAPLEPSHTDLWWDRGPAPIGGQEVHFKGIASDHSLYLAVGERTVSSPPPGGAATEGVAFVGATQVKSCTVVGDFQRSCSPDEDPCVPYFQPLVTFSVEDCWSEVDEDEPEDLSARMAMHAQGGSTEIYPTSLSKFGGVGYLYQLVFSSDKMNSGTKAPFFTVNLDDKDTNVDDRDQVELLVIPQMPPGFESNDWPTAPSSYVAPSNTYDYDGYSEGEECFPTWDEAISSVAGQYVDLVYGRRNPTVAAIGEPQSLERLTTGGSRVVPASYWVDILTARDATNTHRGRYQHDPSKTSDRCTPWAPRDLDPYSDVEDAIGGFSRFRNVQTHGYAGDYERELDGREVAYASLKHDFFGRCHHLAMPGENWPDDGFEEACCTPEEPLLPVTQAIDVYAPFRSRVVLIPAPGAPPPCNGAEVTGNEGGDLESQMDNDPCPFGDLSEATYGSDDPFISRLLGRTLLVWWPDPADSPYDAGWRGAVVMAIDNIDLCVPFNEDGTPSESIVEAGERIGVFSNHQSMDVAMWVNDQHDRWRYVSYFDMLPDNLYAMYVSKFGFAPRYSAAEPDDVDPVISAAERYYECPAMPFMTSSTPIDVPEDPDEQSLALACQVRPGSLSGTLFTPEPTLTAPAAGRVWCKERLCKTAGTGAYPWCRPEPEVCADPVVGGCLVPTYANAALPACAGDLCAEVACPIDRFVSSGLRGTP